jgi:4-amino-4-deoxy-L-arabinose transferase-like glycosyltransferase
MQELPQTSSQWLPAQNTGGLYETRQLIRVLLLKTNGSDARLKRLNSTAPMRSLAAEEASFQIPLWSVPFVLLLLYVGLFSGLGALGLVGPDEPRYAAIARAMAETHDWITPRLWGTPWFEKPVLYYWTAGIAMRIFGVSEFAARLPSALAALLVVAAVKWTALRSYGVGAAWYSLLMLPTSVAMIGFSRAAGPDMLFAGLLTAAMAVASEMLQKPRPGPILRIAFGFFLGAAVLAKGPAAVILAGGATLLWAALTRQWRAPFRFLHPVVIAVFCGTALPWYVLCALRNPDFLRIFIWQHNFERFTTPIFEHRQPIWFYGYILLLAVLPWIAFLFGALLRAAVRLKQRAAIESVDLFFACWTAFPILFFSFSQSKLPGYILPAIPPLFLLLGHWVSESIQRNSKMAAHTLASTGAALSIVAVAFASTKLRTDYYPSKDFRVELLIFILGAAIALLAFKKRVMAGFAVMALTVIAAVEMANFVVLPEIDSAVSYRQLATKLLRDGASGRDLSLYGVSRETEYGLNYYFDCELPIWVPGKSEPEWILVRLPMDMQIARRYDVVDDNPLNQYIPVFSLNRRKQRAQ